MKAKTVRRTVVASIATVAGVFGGLKLYAMKKQRQRIGMESESRPQEPYAAHEPNKEA